MISPSELLDPAVSHPEVEAVIRKQWETVQFGEFVLCLGLRRLYRDNVHRGCGQSNFNRWAGRRFEMHPKLVGLFSFLGEHLERLPLTRAAMEKREITYTKAREFVRIATVENETTWIEYAKTHTNRQLERKVKRWKAEQAGEEHVEKKEVVSELTPEQEQAARAVRERLTRETGKFVPERQLLPTLLDHFTEGKMEDLKPVKPYASIQFCPVCLHTWVPTAGANVAVEVTAWLDAVKDGAEIHEFVTAYLCDCEGAKHRRDRCPSYRPPSGEPAKSRHVPAGLQRRIAARDGMRCRMPACSNQVMLDKGHLGTPFRDGAPMTEANLGTHCTPHNQMIETGAVRVVGYAPFERYYDRDGKFLGYGFDPEPAGEREDPDEVPGRGFARPDRRGRGDQPGDPHGESRYPKRKEGDPGPIVSSGGANRLT